MEARGAAVLSRTKRARGLRAHVPVGWLARAIENALTAPQGTISPVCHRSPPPMAAAATLSCHAKTRRTMGAEESVRHHHHQARSSVALIVACSGAGVGGAPSPTASRLPQRHSMENCEGRLPVLYVRYGDTDGVASKGRNPKKGHCLKRKSVRAFLSSCHAWKEPRKA